MSQRITEFRGEYSFLSNFYPAPVTWHGIMFPTLEHAYQAAKADNDVDRRRIAICKSAGDAKRLGRKIRLRSDWEDVKLAIMKTLLCKKFSLPSLADKLRATGDAELIEGNHWGDTFWGICRGDGENHLGKLLMQIRTEIRRDDPTN